MKLTFNTRYEQLEYEIDNLVRTSRDPQFTNYLKGLIYDARTNPADIPKMRRDLISGYDMYSSRMAQMGIPVEPMFFRAIYGNMEAPEVLEDKVLADMQSEEASEATSGQTAEAAQNTDTYQNTEAVQNAGSMEEAAQDTDSFRTAGAEISNDPAVTQSYIPADVPQYNSSQDYSADSIPLYNGSQDYSADSVPQYNSSQDYSADSVPQYNNSQDHIADSVPQYGVSQDPPRHNGFQGQPQQAYAPQYTYPQQNPQTASVITSPKAEYAIGAIVMSVLGSVFLLTGLVYFAVNYLDSFAQGMIMYAVCALVLLVSEFVIRRVVPKLSAVFTAIGISGVFLTTVVNYKSLGNISLGIAAVLLALCSALVCLFGYVRKSQLYSVIGFLAAFISSVAIGNHVNPVEFIAITVGTLIISTMWLFFPASGRKDVLTPVMILAELMYFLATSTFDIETPDVAMAVVSRIIFAAASWLVICLIYFVSDNWSSKRSNNDQTVDTVNLVIYLVSAFVYGLAIRIMFEARHLLLED
ncbi:MAG: hypothetical protein ILP17_06550, partial [Lachnospiraceae bacterium]|nr:hypothetical protein [Lachnospiraceae bacterium]